MPITPILITSLNATLTANTIVGLNARVLAPALGTAIGSWAVTPGAVKMQGVTTGTAGAGAVTGKITVLPNPIAYQTAFTSCGLVGISKTPLTLAISTAVSTAFNTGIYVGNSKGVGVGTDISKVVFVNTSSLVSILNSTFTASVITGINSRVLAQAVSIGVSTQLLTGFGTGVVAGPPSPAPSVGSSSSNVVI
jgi:hypothetical protein